MIRWFQGEIQFNQSVTSQDVGPVRARTRPPERFFFLSQQPTGFWTDLENPILSIEVGDPVIFLNRLTVVMCAMVM